MAANSQPEDFPRVMVVGGGFAGLAVTRALRRAPAEVVLVDRHNHHLFQPLLYQVATAALSPADIAAPIRKIVRRQRNCRVVLAEVAGVDLEGRTIAVAETVYAWDYLVLAAGVRTNYFGNGGWAEHAPGLKTIDEAIELRCRFLLAFEQAEIEYDDAARRAALTFAIVGAGPTGVEMAGAYAEISRRTLTGDFREIDTSTVRIILIDLADRVLSGFPPELSARAKRDLESMGVEVMLGTRVIDVDERGLSVERDSVERDGRTERIDANNVMWAAGVRAEPIGAGLGVETDRMGRVIVGDDLSVPGAPEVFVVGDLAHRVDPKLGDVVPGVAPAAMQMGRFAGDTIATEIRARHRGEPVPPRRTFVYRDKGTMATIGRNRAVAALGRLRFGGMLAFLLWGLVHILFLIDFRRRIIVFAEWTWMYWFSERGVRLITGAGSVPKPVKPPPDPRLARREGHAD